MAPTIDREADHVRDKARKDLLALLEGVSMAAAIIPSRPLLTCTGPRKEELGP
jgi:hypothetical protein